MRPQAAKSVSDSRDRIVILESPFASPTEQGLAENLSYARACLRDCLIRGESPFASHLLYTQPGVLDDDVPDEREVGIGAGLVFQAVADLVAVYTDRGISQGMNRAIQRAHNHGIPVEYRSLDIPTQVEP